MRQVAAHKRLLVSVNHDQRAPLLLQRYLDDYQVLAASTVAGGCGWPTR